MIVFQRIKLMNLFLPRRHFKQKAFGYKSFSFFHFNFLSSRGSKQFVDPKCRSTFCVNNYYSKSKGQAINTVKK